MRKTPQELDGDDWGEPVSDSHLVVTCHRLRRKPLEDFTAEDLRIMLAQRIDPDYLVPLAVPRLQLDPLAAGDFFRGDVLEQVLRLPEDFWTDRPQLTDAVAEIAALARDLLASEADADEETNGSLKDAIDAFLGTR